MFKSVGRLHETLFSASKGRLAGSAGGMPVVRLTTTGRTSGQPRTTMLTTPLRDGDSVVIVASKGGDARHPDWYRNLCADPKVDVVIGGESQAMIARVAEGAERGELWARIIADQPRYGIYQDKTEREIPVIVLEPT